MFLRLVGESFLRNPRRTLLTAAALALSMAVSTATLTLAFEVSDRMAREFRTLGANLLVTPQADTLPLEVGGVDYRPVDEGAYLSEADLGKLKTIFWRHNILGFTAFLDVPVYAASLDNPRAGMNLTLIGTWYAHEVAVPDGTKFKAGLSATNPSWQIRGRWFDDGANEAVVGRALAGKSPGVFTIGKAIEVARDASSNIHSQLLITGIVTTGDAEDQAILVPLSVAQHISGHFGQLRQLYVSALTKPADSLAERDPKTFTPTEYDRWFCSPYISSISYQIEQVLPGTDVRAIRRVADSEGRILSHVTTLLWIVTLAALAAAALAVAATSATSVLERRAEIGVMKALGATNTLVAGLFLTEQLILAVGGGAIGFLLGAAMARVLGASVFGAPSSPHLLLLPIVIGTAAAVAVIGSLIPLRRAAHFHPAPILRGQ
jgi:putative ABC transport system permease protein